MTAARGLLTVVWSASVVACGFKPGASVVDAPPIDAVPPDAVALPVSCLDLHARTPELASGPYEIDPDGPGAEPPYTVSCDMDTGDGGWTLVFVADVNIVDGPQAYSVTQPILDGAQDVLIAFRSSVGVAAANYATFPMPALWRNDTPFNYQANDLPLLAKVNGSATAIATTLRYGYANYANYCTDPWNTASTLGRVCLTNTMAPYYTSFRYPTGDFCNSSMMDWRVVDCTAERRFTIAVR